MFLKDTNNFTVTKADTLTTARTINGTSFNGSANITTANWGTARTLTIGNSGKSVNGSGNVSWTLAEIGAAAASHTHSYAAIANAVQRWNCGIKCATWSRLLYLTGNTTVGHSFILNIQGTRSSVVFNASFLVNTSHSSVASIVQLNNTKYSNFQIRVVTNSNGEAYIEVYDNANSATNATTQTLNVSFTALSGIGTGTLTKYTSFTDGSTLASGFTVAHTITTVSGSHYSGNAATATQLQNARTINGTSFNGSANITTANWGTARNIYIADNDGTNTGSAVSVNGSANATLKLPATIKASLSGNASTSTKATQDSAGQQINTTYIKGLSVSGKTITYTKGDGSTGTITTQDTNTTYSVGTASALGLTKLYTGTGTATDGTMTQNAINTALGGKANSSHTHGLLHDNFTVEVANTTTDSGWSMINSNYNGYILKSIRSNASAPAWLQSNYAAGIAFGGSDTKGVMSMAYNSPSVRFAGGNGTKPVWYFTLTGTSAKSYNMDSLAANTANTLATSRTINGTSFNGSANITTANWGTARTLTVGNTGKSVNGSGNVSWSLSEIGAAPSSSSSLKTTDKTIVGAINEVFQSGNNVKQNLVDTLIAKGAEDISTSNSWDDLIDIIDGSNIDLLPASFTVEKLSCPYGFNLLSSGYYESQNKGVDSSYAMCKLNIVSNDNYNVYLDCISYGESNYDYGIISNKDTPLSFSSSADKNVLKSFKGLSSSSVQTVQLSSNSGFYYIKYIKDSSDASGNDSLRFKVRFVKKTNGGSGGSGGGVTTTIFGPETSGDNTALTGGYTHKEYYSSSSLTVSPSNITLFAYSASTGSTRETAVTNNRIDITGYSKLKVKGYYTTMHDIAGGPYVGFDSVGNNDASFAASVRITSTTTNDYELDISHLTGNYYLKLSVPTKWDNMDNGAIYKYLYVYEMVLVP